jgi:hypothetical protein
MVKTKEPKGEPWKKFLRRHGGMTLFFIAGIALIAIVGLLVFLKVLADAQLLGLVPALLGEWSVAYAVTFCLTVIFWELVFVASWAVPIIVIIYFQWYKKLPEEELMEYEGLGKRAKTTGEDGFSFFVGLIWLGIVWFTGRWTLAFQSWTLNDWVITWLWACVPVLVLAGILGTAYVAWSLGKD